MVIALIAFSAAIVALSLYGVVLPQKLIALVRGFMAGPGVWGAAAIRVLLAVLLWFVAPVSHTPVTFKILALLALIAAVALPIIGASRLIKLIDWIASRPPLAARFQCLLGVAFGAFLIWSALPGLGAT